MVRPTFVLFRLPSRSLDDLAKTLDALRRALTALRRRACFTRVRSAVGACHAELFSNGRIWNAHVQAVLDIAGEGANLAAWEAEVDRVFRGLTQGRGRFSIDPYEPHVEPGKELRIARYMFKAETCAPAPGALDLLNLEILIGALHRRQLAVRWGFTRRGRRPATDP